MRKRYTPMASVVSRDAHDRCTVPGCIRRPMNWGGAFCTRHHHRAFEHGHVDATAVTIAELREFVGWLDNGLLLYHDTPAVKIALKRADRLLHFTPMYGLPWEGYFAGRMAAVRTKAGEPVDARRVLLTVLSYLAFEAAHPERVPNTDVRDIGVARSLIRLGRCRQPQPRKSDLIPSGRHIIEQLGTFGVAFIEELKRRTRADNLKRQREEAALTDFRAPNAGAA